MKRIISLVLALVLLSTPALALQEHSDFAIGMGFMDTIEGFHDLTLEQCREMGVNDSVVHEDFMIGTADMKIVATLHDGKTVTIFENGEFTF